MNEYMTSAEVARWLRVDKSTVCSMEDVGDGAASDMGVAVTPSVCAVGRGGVVGRGGGVSVDKLPSGRFRARVKRGRLVVSTKTFDRKKDALAWEAAERVQLAGGFDPRLGKATTVSVAVAEFLSDRAGRVAASTVATDRRFLNALPIGIGRSPVGELTHAEIERYVHRLRVSAGTKKRAIISLSAFFGWTVQRGYRMDNPARGVRVAGEAPVHAAAMATWDDVEKMAATIKDPGYSLYIRVMAYTGLRPGEMRSLRVGDISGGRLACAEVAPRRASGEGREESSGTVRPGGGSCPAGLGASHRELCATGSCVHCSWGRPDRVA